MSLPKTVRVLIGLAITALGLGVMLLLLTISETVLSLQVSLERNPVWLRVGWWLALVGVGLVFGWIIWRILRPRSVVARSAPQEHSAPTEDEVRTQLGEARAAGLDVSRAQREFLEHQRRREAGEIHVALFGEVSSGKSSLINALLPEAQALSEVTAGTTRDVARYRWTCPGGDSLLLTDMPGIAEVDGEQNGLALNEATRAHVVIFVTDTDLNRTQHDMLSRLIALQKPLLLALNKTDYYSATEQQLLTERLRGYLDEVENAAVVTVSAATSIQVFRRLPDGSERPETRQRPPQVMELATALQRMIDGNQGLLDRLSDSATFSLVSNHLDQARAHARLVEAEKLVDGYAKKAAIGALAAITPGSDLLIQGYLVTQLVRELCEIYETKASKVDTDLLLRLIQQHVGRAHTLVLAVAGNALKAFPGAGTLVGGTLHAVAYAIIFRTLGRALITTLSSRGEVHPRQTAQLFEERLGEDLERPARELADMVVNRIAPPADNR